MGYTSFGAYRAGYYRCFTQPQEETRDSVRIHEPDGKETGGGDSGLFEHRVPEPYSERPVAQNSI